MPVLPIVVDLQKAEIHELLERRVVASRLVDRRDEVFDVSGAAPVPYFDLVFLRVEVLLFAFDGSVLAELETTVDAVARRQRGGKNESRLEGGAAAVLEDRRQNIRGVHEEVRPEVQRRVRPRELGEVLHQFGFRVPPCEVRI